MTRILLVAATVGACAAPTRTVPEGEVPDFSLTDVNETSSSYNQAISPRDHLGGVSAWYFGHAT